MGEERRIHTSTSTAAPSLSHAPPPTNSSERTPPRLERLRSAEPLTAAPCCPGCPACASAPRWTSPAPPAPAPPCASHTPGQAVGGDPGPSAGQQGAPWCRVPHGGSGRAQAVKQEGEGSSGTGGVVEARAGQGESLPTCLPPSRPHTQHLPTLSTVTHLLGLGSARLGPAEEVEAAGHGGRGQRGAGTPVMQQHTPASAHPPPNHHPPSRPPNSRDLAGLCAPVGGALLRAHGRGKDVVPRGVPAGGQDGGAVLRARGGGVAGDGDGDVGAAGGPGRAHVVAGDALGTWI